MSFMLQLYETVQSVLLEQKILIALNEKYHEDTTKAKAHSSNSGSRSVCKGFITFLSIFEIFQLSWLITTILCVLCMKDFLNKEVIPDSNSHSFRDIAISRLVGFRMELS